MAQSKLVSFVILITILLASDFLVKFQHENMISIIQRIFHGKNGLNFKKDIKLSNSYDMFQKVGTNIEGSLVFLFSYCVYSQIWLTFSSL